METDSTNVKSSLRGRKPRLTAERLVVRSVPIDRKVKRSRTAKYSLNEASNPAARLRKTQKYASYLHRQIGEEREGNTLVFGGGILKKRSSAVNSILLLLGKPAVGDSADDQKVVGSFFLTP